LVVEWEPIMNPINNNVTSQKSTHEVSDKCTIVFSVRKSKLDRDVFIFHQYYWDFELRVSDFELWIP
jgi:hypothetical protein